MNSHETLFGSRRRFLASAAGIGAAALMAPRSLLGKMLRPHNHLCEEDGVVQQFRRAAANAVLEVQNVRGNVNVVTGAGCNVVALASNEGVVLVDTGLVGAKVGAAVASISRAPITHVINTHWHFDHTDGNEWLNAHGATVVAHENTRRHLSVDTHVEDWFHFTFPASPAGALPTMVFTDERSLQLNTMEVTLKRYTPAHTDSDISVHYAGANVLCAGDTWWNGVYPFIDYATGGSIDGMIRAADESLSMAAADTIIVPGHGPLGRAADLAKFRDMLATIRGRVAALKAQGRSESDIVAAKPSASFDAAWGGWAINPEFFTRLVYKGV